LYSEGSTDGASEKRSVRDRGQFHQIRGRSGVSTQDVADGEGDPGFADAAGSRHRHEPVGGQHPDEIIDLVPTADKRRTGRRKRSGGAGRARCRGRGFTTQLARSLSCRDRLEGGRVVRRQTQRLGEKRYRVAIGRTPIAALERADPDGTHPGPLGKRILRQPGRQSMAAQQRPECRNRRALFLHCDIPPAIGSTASAATVRLKCMTVCVMILPFASPLDHGDARCERRRDTAGEML